MAKVRDPVCGMTFDEEDAVATAQYQGKTYFFCSEDCKDEFEEEPATYAEEA